MVVWSTVEDNPFASDETMREYEEARKTNPEFAHEWLGQLQDDLNEKHLFTYGDLWQCVEAYKEYEDCFHIFRTARTESGLDIAGEGRGLQRHRRPTWEHH